MCKGIYCVTGGTYQKAQLFNTPSRLLLLEETLLSEAKMAGWQLHAWAILNNHYHFIGLAPEEEDSLQKLVHKVHSCTARAINREDQAEGRRVWYQYWDSRITYEKSYLARLAYVHRNPVHHGLVAVPEQYEWCSASWFKNKNYAPFYETVMSFKTDLVQIKDDF